MGMLGNQLAAGQALTIANDSFNGDGSTTAFTLSQAVGSVNDIEVLVDNVQQSPYDSSYSVSGTTLTFSGAPSAGTNNVYVIYNASKHITTQQVIPDDGSVHSSKIASNAVTTSKITNNAVTMAKLPSALSFSGKTVSNFTNPNGYNLLASRTDTSNVDYGGNVVILDFSSYINDYNTFWFSINVDATGADGNQHYYLTPVNTSGTLLNMAMTMHGYNASSSVNTPQTGANGGYFRFAYRQYKQMACTLTGYIHNHPNTGAQNATMQLQSNWQYAGVGAARANGSIRVTSTDKIAKLNLNFDAGDAGGGDSGSTNSNCRVVAELYGIR
jgi:hypothetical protein